MEKYKLKEGARQFFKEETHRYIDELSVWKQRNIPIELLDEVSDVYIELGHTHKLASGANASSLNGWSYEGKEAHYHFTIKVKDIEYTDYQKVDIGKLMDEIQKSINKHFKYRFN